MWLSPSWLRNYRNLQMSSIHIWVKSWSWKGAVACQWVRSSLFDELRLGLHSGKSLHFCQNSNLWSVISHHQQPSLSRWTDFLAKIYRKPMNGFYVRNAAQFLQWRFHLQISTSKSMRIFSICPSTLPTSSHIPNFPRASNSIDLLAPRHSALDSSSQSPPFASIDRYLGMWFIDDGEKSNSLAKTIQYVYIYMIYVYMSIWKMSTNAQLLLFTVVYFSLLLLINTIVYYYCLLLLFIYNCEYIGDVYSCPLLTRNPKTEIWFDWSPKQDSAQNSSATGYKGSIFANLCFARFRNSTDVKLIHAWGIHPNGDLNGEDDKW